MTESNLFMRVVCAVGGRGGGLEGVRQVERLRPDGEVVLVSVCESYMAVHAGMHSTKALADLHARAQRVIDAALEYAPVSRTRMVSGRPAGALLWVLGDEQATLVAVGDVRKRAAGIILGNVATRLLHDAPCSVLVARETPAPEEFPRSIVVGIDGSPESLAAAEVAGELSRRLGVGLKAIAATGGKPLDFDGLAQSRLDFETEEASPVDALVRAAEGSDLLVVGSRGLHGIRALGSVSERVAHRASCSVLVVRPHRLVEPGVSDEALGRGRFRVADVMTSPVVTATPDATIEDVARLMIERNIGSVVITDAMGSPVGIVTETDFEVADDPIPFTFLKWPRVLGKYVWSGESLEGIYREMRERHVDSVMSSPVEAVDVNASLWQAVQLMVLRDIKRVPVLDGQRLVGIVSQHDLLKCLLDESGHAGT